ncbi:MULTISPECIES: Eco57I restriction-modification methylase domain-containing protein [unclassified Chryseobacterium]|uniref:Eco57I restriction-modification methylase domain-containing protein n=1 Tax=unclassified Chryseobacterium TaxID=2593645 RepID=UPI0027D82C96|nr:MULTISPECIES: TaqI-like C-terminal specificity domain-containing protein [unclassified Chryseobacterium]
MNSIKYGGLNSADDGYFDIVIGNPPYVSVKKISIEDKLIFSKTYKTAVGQFDLYGLFIEKSIDFLKLKGVLSFITSNTFLNNKDFSTLREYLLNKTNIQSIVNLDESIFETAQVDVAITTLTKGIFLENNTIRISRCKNDFINRNYDLIKQQKYNIKQNQFEFKLNCTEKDFKIIEKIYRDKTLLSSIMELPRGIEIGSNSDLICDENTQNAQKLLVGKDISRYTIEFKNRFIEFDCTNKSVYKDISIYKSNKILIQRIRNLSLKQRLVCCFDDNNYLCTNTLRIGIIRNEDFLIKFILGILNSNTINYLFLKSFLNKDIYAYQLEQIPIPTISKEKQQPIISLVEKILSSKKQNPKSDTTEIENKIDKLVYKLYELTSEEISIIENT